MAGPPTDPRYDGIDIDALFKQAKLHAAWRLRNCSYVPYSAEDLAQQAFLSLHRRWYLGLCSPLKYLKLAVNHEINDYFRGAHFRYTVHLNEQNFNENLENFGSNNAENPSQYYDSVRETIELLRHVQEKHSGAHAVASWILIEDVDSITEIAVLMKLKRHQVEYFKNKLRDIMREYYSKTENRSSPEARLLKLVDRLKS